VAELVSTPERPARVPRSGITLARRCERACRFGVVKPPSERDGPAPVAPAESWLLTTGWRIYHPLISPLEVPGPDTPTGVPEFEAYTSYD
jgi:hypothetical protein